MSSAALLAGLPSSSVPALLTALGSGEGLGEVPGASETVVKAAMRASEHVYAAAYRLAWSSIIPFVVLALVAIWFLRGVEELMTEHVEASVEKDEGVGEKVVV